jgi:hypothetical protein
MQGWTNSGRQVAMRDKILYGGTKYFLVLSMDLASCHTSGAENFNKENFNTDDDRIV